MLPNALPMLGSSTRWFEPWKSTALDGEHRVVRVWRDAARVRGEPFDAIELELGARWAD
jgi:hypothetical protein